MNLVIGVDGGGTRTRAVLMSADGVELARCVGAAGWIDAAAPVAAADAVAALCGRLLEQAGIEPPVHVLCCGLAGAGAEAERDAVRVSLMLTGLASAVMITGDAQAAMYDAFGNDPGVLLIGGTGSIAWARGPAGIETRAGGWGPVLGDRGSGHAIGVDALRAVVSAGDGMAPDTQLTPTVLQHLGLASVRMLVPWTATAARAGIAALAPLVTRCAADGDGTAASILADATDALVALAVAAARRAGLHDPDAGAAAPRFPVALHGALISRDGPLRDAVCRRLARVLPHADPLPHDVDAARGAAAMALGPAPLSDGMPHP